MPFAEHVELWLVLEWCFGLPLNRDAKEAAPALTASRSAVNSCKKAAPGIEEGTVIISDPHQITLNVDFTD